VAIKSSIYDLEFFRRKREAKLEEIDRARILREEQLKKSLLDPIYHYLLDNKYYDKLGKTCVELGLLVDRSQKEDLVRILKHTEFSSVTVRIVEDDPDLVKCYSYPLLVKIVPKTGNTSGETVIE
jgi:SMC interacting uncharacterized protein involved in chromosome segregation